MQPQELKIYNTLSREKEIFTPIQPPLVGLYVCGPTVYGDAHLGHARPAVTFDTVYRYLQHLNYKVRYVRNITDVGHLQGDSDDGEDKIAKKAKLEQLEPMEVAQHYTDTYHRDMEALNTLKPNIEPRATGHIPEQIKLVQEILDNGLAYEVNGSVYFDVLKYNKEKTYGKLSGRVLEELLSGSRELEGQNEKRNPIDFALWKKASPEHLMKWESPWGLGFPGWHLECTAMSSKYLGNHFDIHGGGMDLMFPHHECEIAQGNASHDADPAKYWMHNNMITINGQKMGKSLGNFITLQELFSGKHELLDQAYTPMTVRFFILTAHYRSTLDFSNEALKAAQKGYKKIINGLRVAKKLEFQEEAGVEKDEKQIQQVEKSIENAYRAMNDDFNTAQAIGHLFNILKKINSLYTGQLKFGQLGKAVFDKMIQTFTIFVEDILGLVEESENRGEELLEILLKVYKEAKLAKNYDRVDEIRSALKDVGVVVKDMKDKVDWAYEE
ncbi:cysteine--tRNA ligase [Echinicola jeungdonensis]|uniref:Cysteine--tRNA ligase n=1 Tax=Echinicola jeungdonensis TaxID=709343 RepID=A0ABV5J5K0_9BACT|nr:cysteine--tRNA ligase [Echinicola jeungdonensis]MDN3668719.1 cysteine--tRNA ligase [Echinicola jeungdonensis]